MQNIIGIEHGKYIIKAGKLGDEWVARAFLKSPSKTRGTVAEARGKSSDEAVEAVQALLRDGQTKFRSARRWEERAGFSVPSRDEYELALLGAQLSSAQIAMLKAHAAAGEEGLTAGELAGAAGYPHYETANSIYGKAGRVIGNFLDLEAPKSILHSGDVATGILAWDGAPRPESGYFVWVMYPELREAVRNTL